MAPRQLQESVTVQGTTSPASGSAPTLSTQGLDLDDLLGFAVSVYCADGQTLSGSGSLLAWKYNTDSGAASKWSRNPELDVALSASGVQVANSSDVQVDVPRGRVYYQASGVTFTGGGSGGVTVRIDGWSR